MSDSNNDHLGHELFLLMINLSQYNDSERVKTLFVEAMNRLFEGVNFSLRNMLEPKAKNSFEIKTLTNSYGVISIDADASIGQESMTLIHNAISMLATVLESRKREILLAKKTEQLEITNKDLETFCYSVSHDLRAPLRSIKGFSEMLLEDFGDTVVDEARDYLNRIHDSSLKMGSLIEAILGLFQIGEEQIKKQEINLSQLTFDVISELEVEYPNHSVQTSIQNDIFVYADLGLTKIVLQNLLNNAWKYTSRTEHPKVEMRLVNNYDEKSILIRDNGIGFDMKYEKDLFVPFRQLHSANAFPGNGIGLATVQRIFRYHHGKIWAYSELGKGADFFFQFASK